MKTAHVGNCGTEGQPASGRLFRPQALGRGRNGPQGSVYEPRVVEAGSRWPLVSPFGVKSMTMCCGTALPIPLHHPPRRRGVSSAARGDGGAS